MMKKVLLALLILIIILLLPLVFKNRDHRSFSGPDLSELEYSEISFMNSSENLKLSGMLFIPEGEGPFPIAVIIQGSGTSSRNNSWYLSVVKHLQDNGVGVLLPDKRGSEKSGGTWVGANMETLATDTESAIDFVINNSQLSYSEIGIIGMSQGGWIAPIVASKKQDLSFVINMSGAMVSTDEQLLFEEYHNIAPYTYEILAKLISPITTNNLKKRESITALMGFNPVKYWKKVNSPVFIGYGENDTNCPIDASIKRLTEENLNHFEYRVYPNGGHGILDIHTNKLSTDFLNDMIRFIFDKTTGIISDE